MIPGKYNILCPQGSTLDDLVFTYSIDSVIVDLFGWTARMQVREKYSSYSAILSLTTENDGIFLGGVDGTIILNISALQTSAIVAKEYVYDIELINPSTYPYRFLEGKFIVTPEVTR